MPTDIARKVADHFKTYPLRRYAKGEIVIHGGEAPSAVFYIESGTVRQHDISRQGDEVVVNVFRPGAFFPMLWVLTGRENQYFFTAESDLAVRVVPSEEALTFLKANADVALDLLRRLYVGVDGLLGRMVYLMSASARGRLLYELLVQCRRFGTPVGEGCELALKETDLAAYAGLARETVSRELQKLVKEGVVTVSREKLRVADLGALEKLVEAAG